MKSIIKKSKHRKVLTHSEKFTSIMKYKERPGKGLLKMLIAKDQRFHTQMLFEEHMFSRFPYSINSFTIIDLF